MAQTRLGLAVVANPLEVGAADVPRLIEVVERAFVDASFPQLQLVSAPQSITSPDSSVEVGRFFYDQRVDAVCVLAACWFEDYLVADLLEECDVPLIVWARPGMETGSLCGSQQLGFLLRQLEKPFYWLFAEPGNASGLAQALDFAVAAALRRVLRRARIGYLGHRIQGMTEITGHELALKKKLGPRVVGIDTHQFLARAASVPPESIMEKWEELKKQVGQVTASDTDGVGSLRVHSALSEWVSEQGLSAVAAGCYPHLMGRVCLAASLLAEQGVPVSCEGDINAAVGMLMLTQLSGTAVHNTDLLDPLEAENAIVFSHCGSGGFSLAESPGRITLSPVRLMNCGLCCVFPAKPGPVTLLNLVPSLGSYRMAALFGEALPTEMVFPGNPLKVRFHSSLARVLEWIAAEGLGHHWMAAYGDWRSSLKALAELSGVGWLSMS